MAENNRPLRIFLTVGEESGDQLGAGLMRALSVQLRGQVEFSGVGGAAMAAEGLRSLFRLQDIALMGFGAAAVRLPRTLMRMRETWRAILASNPDVLVIIDSPDFTHWVARRVRSLAPHIPIVDYVSPSVWAWRPGRARAMAAYVDRVLALLPFEPAVHAALGGPPCTYVGHPLAETISELRPSEAEERRRRLHPPVLLVLPGSRRGEVRRLLAPFGEAASHVRQIAGPLELVVPTVAHVHEEVVAATRLWPERPRVTVDAKEKRAAFRIARAAIAASGTVTLELALAGVPMVAAYRLGTVEAAILRRMIKVPSVILANLVLGENVVREFLQEACTSDRLAAALAPLIGDTPERNRQLEAFARLDALMEVGTTVPSVKAAETIIALVRQRQRSAP